MKIIYLTLLFASPILARISEQESLQPEDKIFWDRFLGNDYHYSIKPTSAPVQTRPPPTQPYAPTYGTNPTTELKVGNVVVNVALMRQNDGSINVNVVDVGVFKITASGIEFQGIMVDGEIPSFFLPFPAEVQITEGGALQLTHFLLLQMQAAVAAPGEGAGRRLDSPGCDLFPDAPCNLGCCAIHDQCYAINMCNAKSWARSICEPLLTAGILALVPLGPFGTLACTTSLLFISGECTQCNNVAVGYVYCWCCVLLGVVH
jgi:hypothetical protein